MRNPLFWLPSSKLSSSVFVNSYYVMAIECTTLINLYFRGFAVTSNLIIFYFNNINYFLFITACGRLTYKLFLEYGDVLEPILFQTSRNCNNKKWVKITFKPICPEMLQCFYENLRHWMVTNSILNMYIVVSVNQCWYWTCLIWKSLVQISVRTSYSLSSFTVS